MLFRGGDTFAGVTLSPHIAGTAQKPIVFGAYGSGEPTLEASDGAVFLTDGTGHLEFRQLTLTTGTASPSSIFQSSATGNGSTDIRIVHCRLFATGGAGILSKQASDTGWQIVHNRISHTGDSGIILLGGNTSVRDNVIEDVGLNPAIAWPRHSIYVKAANVSVTGNQIRGFPSDGISLRFPNAKVFGNSISRGPIGIAYYSYSPAAGVSLVESNTIEDVSAAGFYYDPTAYAGGNFPRESFIVRGNTVETSGGAGIDVQGAGHVSMEIEHNSIGGRYVVGLVANVPVGGSYREDWNRFLGEPVVRWNGNDLSIDAYRAVSGQGLHDTFRR